MERIKFSVLAVLLLCFTAEGAVKAQITAERIYLRSSIEKYPPSEGRPLLKYLDDQRPLADKVMKLVAEQKADALYELLSYEARKEVSLEQFRALLLRWKQAAGDITSYEYRSQAFLIPYDDSTKLDMDKVKSQVWYAVKVSTQTGTELFVVVKTGTERNKNVVSSVQFLNYGDNIPPWLRLPAAGTNK